MFGNGFNLEDLEENAESSDDEYETEEEIVEDEAYDESDEY